VRYLSVCSGIEAASAAWHDLGWAPLAFSEIEPFPSAVLAQRFPRVPLHGDFTVLRDQSWIVDADLLVGGTPCQAFSVAGLRGSLADARGNLTLEFVRLANAIDDLRRAAGRAPSWIVWENVPGVLSVSDNAFGAFLGGLVGSDAAIEPPRGRGWTDAGVVSGPLRCAAWRVLDAQFFGVAQRRRRVFVLARGGAGDWSAADALLPIGESVRWHPAPRRQPGQRPAPSLAARTRGGGGLGTDCELDGGLIADARWPAEIAPTLQAAFGKKQGLEDQHALGGAGLFVAHSLRAEGFDASEDGTTHAMGTGSKGGKATVAVAVAFDTTQITSAKNRTKAEPGLPASTIAARSRMHVATHMQVRRLTPRECERLQGFPDDWTLIPWRGKPAAECPDGPRYKALGNSMAVPCMRWIGQRIAKVSA
jgi:DNA (cytosine-5)-methyltransferase 1